MPSGCWRYPLFLYFAMYHQMSTKNVSMVVVEVQVVHCLQQPLKENARRSSASSLLCFFKLSRFFARYRLKRLRKFFCFYTSVLVDYGSDACVLRRSK